MTSAFPDDSSPEWVQRIEDLPGWAFSSMPMSQAVRTIWHDWDLVAEVFGMVSRGFLLRQVSWWQLVDVSSSQSAPEQYDPFEAVSFDQEEYEEWPEMDGEGRHENLLSAARFAVAADGLDSLASAVHEAHVAHVWRVHGGRFYNIGDMTCSLLSVAAELDEPGADTLGHDLEDAGRFPWLAAGMKELRMSNADREPLPPYLWHLHPDPSVRTEWAEVGEREWSPSRSDFRPWSDPFPVDPGDVETAKKVLQAMADAEPKIPGLTPMQRRLVRVTRQDA